MKKAMSIGVAAMLLLTTIVSVAHFGATSEAQDVALQAEKSNITTKVVTYKDGDTECEGFLAWDSAQTGKRPVVLIVHDWMGRGEFDEAKARDLAGLGYLAFSIDVYGKDVRPANAGEAGKAAGSWKGNIAGLRTRLQAGMKTALADKNADSSKVSAMGFCFGGTCVLELARSGAAVNGVISFHGGLGTDTPEDAANIKGKVLVLHGAADPYANMEEVVALNKEMEDAKVNYEIVLYGHAVHSFTNKAAGDDPKRGAAYDAQADARSWKRMQSFFTELFE